MKKTLISISALVLALGLTSPAWAQRGGMEMGGGAMAGQRSSLDLASTQTQPH